MVHHRYCRDQNDGRNDLVRVKAGMEEAPSDAYRGQRLHHFKITGRCFAQMLRRNKPTICHLRMKSFREEK